jgi:hypothetical protein
MEMNDENPTGMYQDEDGHLTSLGLSLYAEYMRGERNDLPGELERHVESCSYCRHELMSVTDLLDEIDQVQEKQVDYNAVKQDVPAIKRFLPLIRTAAALAAIVLVSWVIQQIIRDRPEEPLAGTGTSLPVEGNRLALDDPMIITQGSDPDGDSINVTIGQEGSGERHALTAPKTETEQYAMAFIPNPAYESIIGGKFRAARDPRISGPELGSDFAFGDTLRFSWTPDEEDAYTLVIVDNQANEVREIDAGAGSRLEWKIDLPPGLYYWKFTGSEHLWKAGKFFVVKNR